MKKKFFQLALGAFILSTGLISCEKDPVCVKCISFTEKGFGATTLCAGDPDVPTEESLNAIIADLETDEIAYTSSQKCN